MKTAQVNLLDEIIVDNFAGGGGASTGIELAIGRPVDIAINHDPDAIALHKMNHPFTEHYCESVWDINPKVACRGRNVALAWFSPDCTHFSKAKGRKPVKKKIRGLAWVALRWAATVKPRVIILENVEEFKTWGPLIKNEFGHEYPDPKRKGETFRSFKHQLEKLGYKVDHQELKACDYGAPTIRKRFFLIARCDGKPIKWPEPTHGEPKSEDVLSGKLLPYRTIAECIDWSLPCPSIFDTAKEIKEKYGLRAVRPLADNTMKRIARGIQKFVIDNPEPFVIKFQQNGIGQLTVEPIHTIMAGATRFGIVAPVMSAIGQTGYSDDRSYSVEEPIRTLVSKSEQILIAPSLIQYHQEQTKDSTRGQKLDRPILTIDGSPRYAMISAFISKHYSGGYKGAGSSIKHPLGTVTSIDHNALVAAFISRQFGTSTGHQVSEPSATLTSVNKSNLVKAFLIKYYGQGTGQKLNEPLGTIVSKDRFGIVTVEGVDYQIVDIGMRMLEPHELYKAQGFPSDYIIDFDVNGKPYSKAEKVKRVGNSVPPQFLEAIVRANLPELCGNKLETMEDFRKEIAI